MHKTNVGILIFEGVEVLDFAGPFEIRIRWTRYIEVMRHDVRFH